MPEFEYTLSHQNVTVLQLQRVKPPKPLTRGSKFKFCIIT